MSARAEQKTRRARRDSGLGLRDSKASQSADKPNSVEDDHSSGTAIARGLERPTRWPGTGSPHNATLFGLAPCGVLPATGVTVGAVRSYRTFSPLPRLRPCGLRRGGIFSVPLFRQVALPGRYPAHCPLEFGLSSRLRLIGSRRSA